MWEPWPSCPRHLEAGAGICGERLAGCVQPRRSSVPSRAPHWFCPTLSVWGEVQWPWPAVVGGSVGAQVPDRGLRQGGFFITNYPKGNQPWISIGRTDAEAPRLWPPDVKLQYFWPPHLKRPWCWVRLKAKGGGGDRGWDGWMSSPTQWTWVWANSGRQWRTGKPGMLQFMRLQKSQIWLSSRTTWSDSSEKWNVFLIPWRTNSLEYRTHIQTLRW